MNRIYRRLRKALVRRDPVALAQLVRSHPEAHGGCERRGTPVAMIAAVGLDILEAAFKAGASPDSDHDAETSQTFLQWGRPRMAIPPSSRCASEMAWISTGGMLAARPRSAMRAPGGTSTS